MTGRLRYVRLHPVKFGRHRQPASPPVPAISIALRQPEPRSRKKPQSAPPPPQPEQLEQLEQLGLDKVPICVAKTQYSFSDDAALLGAPKGFTVTVRNLKVSAGAGFIVALTGDIMTMPGLPKVPAAEKIDVDENGRITGLF